MVYDALVLVLTWAKTYQTNCASSKFHMKNSLTSLIQRDGTIYFFVLLLLNAINLVAIKFEILGSVPALTDVLTSIMVSRFFLDLRSVYLSSTSGSQSISRAQIVPEVISLDFTSSLTGNLGAPLNGWFDEVPDSFSADEPPPAYEWHEPMLLHLRPEADDSDGSDSHNE
ncbi:hypothetical protein SCP_1402760 [Sparassis crispa]|uniref:Uncharacterized protein n=1 Tax=Sparassis crispa TaxID=139825 RepID=A0A401H367_9APHY|nr:hypothetical protein SCP_1402760 [Sparassis crispa]GBE88868.1 hypothetical protein SCP_1402760 [Sparassis crispa]